MPYELILENKDRGVVVTWIESVDTREVCKVQECVYRCEDFFNLHYVIWDFSKVRMPENFSTRGFRQIAMLNNRACIENANFVAAVVTLESAFQSQLRKFQFIARAWATGYRLEFFSDIEAARDWISRTSLG